jgi:hypothetical protein
LAVADMNNDGDLLEGASLNAALVVVPGHALVAWEAWHDTGDWHCLETTLIGSKDFDAACSAGQTVFEEYRNHNADCVRLRPLANLRARGFYPME